MNSFVVIYRPIGLIVLVALLLPSSRASAPRVTCTKSGPAVLGGNIALTCQFSAHMDVLQVTWQRKKNKNVQNMVTYSEQYGINVTPLFRKYVSVLQNNSANSSISISKLEKEDEACYVCLFNVHPNGAYAGKLCLTELGPVNEVRCSAEGTDLDLVLDPPDIQTRQSVWVTEQSGRKRHPLMCAGQYSGSKIKPKCMFQIPRRKRRLSEEGQSRPSEGVEEVIVIQCSAFGVEKPEISWHNAGEPISREDKINITGSVITVTSTRHYNVSSFPANRIFCNILHNSQFGEDPTAAINLLSMDDIKAISGDSRVWRILALAASLAVVVIIVVVILSQRRSRRASTSPKKTDEIRADQATPSSLLSMEDVPETPKSLNLTSVTSSSTKKRKPATHSNGGSVARKLDWSHQSII